MECPECGNTRMIVEETGYSRFWEVSTELNPEGGLQMYERLYGFQEGGNRDDLVFCPDCLYERPLTREEVENAWYS